MDARFAGVFDLVPAPKNASSPLSSQPIGIFDSGLGGLTVLRELQRLLPEESFIYLGDTARVPYGPRSAETVTQYAQECATFLLAKGVKLIVVACNTATAHALAHLQRRCSIPVIGVIAPGAHAAAQQARRLGVIATLGTCQSGAYPQALRDAHFQGEVSMLACPLLVPLIEEGFFHHEATRLILETYLAPLRAQGIDALLLGCTHYPLLTGLIGQVIGENVAIIDSARATATAVYQVMEQNACRALTDKPRRPEFYATDLTSQLERVASQFLEGRAAAFTATRLERVSEL